MEDNCSPTHGDPRGRIQEPNRVRMKLRPNVAWCGGRITPDIPGFACSMQMSMSAPRAQASVAAGSAKTCPALSAVFARLVSAARRVKKMWTNVPSSLRPAGQAAATTPWVHSTVPVQLASAPEGQGPPAKMWTNVPGAPHLVPMAAVKTLKGASSVSALQASSPTLRAPSARMWMSVRTTWPVLGRSV